MSESANIKSITLGITIMQEHADFHVYSFAATFDAEEYVQDGGTPALLESIFDSGNNGSIRDSLLYSLSVGDKVAIDSLANGKTYPMGTYTVLEKGWAFTAPLVEVA